MSEGCQGPNGVKAPYAARLRQQSRRPVGNRRLCLIAPRRCVAGAILENTPSVVSNRRVSCEFTSARLVKGRSDPTAFLPERGNQFKANNGIPGFDLDQSKRSGPNREAAWRGQLGRFRRSSLRLPSARP
jgi:hypothetical protein